MQDDLDWSEPSTILAHDPRFSEGAVVPPLYQTSLFTFESYDQMRATFAGRTGQPVYSRVGNPTTAVFEDKLARLEGARSRTRLRQWHGRDQRRRAQPGA